ncbi:MAG: hypothetical protein JXQ99_02575 [Hyphomicrobiaceae bacterium]
MIASRELQVLTQFSAQSGIQSLIGVTLGFGLASRASSTMKTPFVLDLTIVLIAFGFSALAGIVFGRFPARHAARLNAIEALRHE